MKYFSFLLLLMSTTLFSFSKDMREEMEDNFLSVYRVFKRHYAPLEWKEERFGFRLDDKKQEFLNGLDSCSSVKQWREKMKGFVSNFYDYHVNILFSSSEYATLPFEIRPCGNRYFISWVDTEKAGRGLLALRMGDELITFNGRAIQDALDEFRQEEGFGTSETDRVLACSFFTSRFGALGQKILKGPATVSIASSDGEERVVRLFWEYQPEKIPFPFFKSAYAKSFFPHSMDAPLPQSKKKKVELPVEKQKDPAIASFLNKMSKSMLLPMFQVQQDHGRIHAIGSKKGFLPKLGSIYWEAEESFPFSAYLFSIDGNRLIGYVRIPHYMGSADHIEAFAQLMAFFEEKADGLVIDQLHNPGGSVFYLYALSSFFAEQPLEVPLHEVSLNADLVEEVAGLKRALETVKSDSDAEELFGGSLDGYPADFQFVRSLHDYCSFLLESWQRGEFLTKPVAFLGVDVINPHPWVRFSKPMWVLIDEMDFSGGDFFPAIMQDNQRAKLFGTKTAGAGGCVHMGMFPNLMGVRMFSWTASLAVRPNGKRLENLGVQPDIPYSLTETDLKQDYEDYVRTLKDKLEIFFSHGS